jgi:TPR repeat protein
VSGDTARGLFFYGPAHDAHRLVQQNRALALNWLRYAIFLGHPWCNSKKVMYYAKTMIIFSLLM